MSLAKDFHLAIDDGVARYFRDQSRLRRHGRKPIRIVRDDSGPDQFFFRWGAEFDEDQDYLVEACGTQFVIAKDLGDEIRGWQFTGYETLYSEFQLDCLAPGVVSTASDPGMLTLDRDLLLAHEPELAGGRGLWRRIQDRRHRQSKYLGSFDAVAEQLWRGDSRAALVLQVSPRVLVAAYADDFDAIVVLEFPRSIAKKFSLQPGTKLVTCNFFLRTGEGLAEDITPGPSSHTSFTDFHPIIGHFLSDDMERLETRVATISSKEWERVRQLSDEWLVEFEEGQVRPRLGAALRPTDLIGRMQQVKSSFGRRALAALFDTSLLMTVVLLLWFVFGFGDAILLRWQNPKNPAIVAAFQQHKSVFRTVATFVYFAYATVMLLTPWQGTLGKRLLGLRVVHREGFGRVPIMKAVLRSAWSLLSGGCASLGCLAVLWSRSGQTWHDDYANTCVIYDRNRSPRWDSLVGMSMAVACVLMPIGILWKLETADVIIPGMPLPVNVPPIEPAQLPRILPLEEDRLGEAVSLMDGSVQIRPPKAFQPATTFVGFQHEATKSSITIAISNIRFEVMQAVFEPEQIQASGWTFRSNKTVTDFFGRSSGHVKFEQTTADGIFVTWLFVVSNGDRCATATAMAPKNREDELTPFLEASGATLTWLTPAPSTKLPQRSGQVEPQKADPETSSDRPKTAEPDEGPTRKGGRGSRRKTGSESTGSTK